IQIGFTGQRVSGHAGLATFAGFLRWHRLADQLAGWLPHRRTSPNALAPAQLALGFVVGICAGAKKLAHVSFLRHDPLLPSLLELSRFAHQSTYTRFFAGFTSAGQNLAAFRAAWRWGLARLASRREGYTLDLDSTRLLHEDHHHAEGVRTGHTPQGFKRCLHPLLAVLAEAKLVAGFWLRPGHTRCDNNVIAFTLDLLAYLPRHLRLRRVRADSGFCTPAWLEVLEQKRLAYIVVARLHRPIVRLLSAQVRWVASEVRGTEVAEMLHQDYGWSTARRLVLLRHRIQEKERPGGKRLLECPGYSFQALVTNLPASVPPLEVWRDYNGRSGSENVIKELDAHFGLPQLCLKKFWATEAALSLAVLAYNLSVLFQRHLGWQERVSAGTLRFRLWNCGGIISRTGGVTTIRLSVPAPHRAWWRELFTKLVCPYPNCNAVDPWPEPTRFFHPLNP
ncbi:MAG TPA: IS1380 family transposase, partial [Candidatus Dormibacteraeota bacterium]|nr:IS1380 family transposase [Candidatus Dormibacteraeota bacterium]